MKSGSTSLSNQVDLLKSDFIRFGRDSLGREIFIFRREWIIAAVSRVGKRNPMDQLYGYFPVKMIGEWYPETEGGWQTPSMDRGRLPSGSHCYVRMSLNRRGHHRSVIKSKSFEALVLSGLSKTGGCRHCVHSRQGRPMIKIVQCCAFSDISNVHWLSPQIQNLWKGELPQLNAPLLEQLTEY
jgi:hypothetical protein